MSQFNTETIQKIAHLSRIAISQTDLNHYHQDLVHILDIIDQMNQVNTENVEPMAHPFDQTQVLREDIVTESNQREQLMQNAPAQENGLFLVPKVIE